MTGGFAATIAADAPRLSSSAASWSSRTSGFSIALPLFCHVRECRGQFRQPRPRQGRRCRLRLLRPSAGRFDSSRRGLDRGSFPGRNGVLCPLLIGPVRLDRAIGLGRDAPAIDRLLDRHVRDAAMPGVSAYRQTHDLHQAHRRGSPTSRFRAWLSSTEARSCHHHQPHCRRQTCTQTNWTPLARNWPIPP